jgi:hypothetical protein
MVSLLTTAKAALIPYEVLIKAFDDGMNVGADFTPGLRRSEPALDPSKSSGYFLRYDYVDEHRFSIEHNRDN